MSACTSIGSLSIYSLTENELASVIKDELPNLSRNVKVVGIPVKFTVEDAVVLIGPNGRNIIALDLKAIANVSVLFIEYPIRMGLQVEGKPYYDSKQNAIFLKQVDMINANIDAGGYKGDLGVLNNEAMKILSDYLGDNPVYTLDKSDPAQALISSIPLNLQIDNGELRLVPTL